MKAPLTAAAVPRAAPGGPESRNAVMPSPTDKDRFDRAIARIDDANQADPNTIAVDGRPQPKELAHARMLTDWIRRLRPDASEPLLLAARAHHIRRWSSPRSSYPKGRRAYLDWRRNLHQFHAQEVGRILQDVGYDADTIARVQQIVRKERLRADPEVQALEDGLCLVFLQTQIDDLTDSLEDQDKMVSVLRKTWRKMSPAGRDAALQLDLSERARSLIEEALAGPASASAGRASSPDAPAS